MRGGVKFNIAKLRAPEILLVLNEAESYHWLPSLWVEQLFMQTPDATGAAPDITETLAKLGTDDKTG